MHIDERDVIILDFIIEKLIESKGTIWSKSLTENGYLTEPTEKAKEYEFRRLLNIIREYNCAKPTKGTNSWDFVELNENTLNFKKYGGFSKIYQDQLDRINKAESIDKLKTKNLELQNENLEFSQTIREQEAKIRNLELKIKGIELIKQYWWFIGICIGIGVFLKALWDIVIAYIR